VHQEGTRKGEKKRYSLLLKKERQTKKNGMAWQAAGARKGKEDQFGSVEQGEEKDKSLPGLKQSRSGSKKETEKKTKEGGESQSRPATEKVAWVD